MNKLDVFLLDFDGQLRVGIAPAMSHIIPGDKVVVENITGCGTVVWKDYMTPGESQYEILTEYVYPHKITKLFSFRDVDWEGYSDDSDDD